MKRNLLLAIIIALACLSLKKGHAKTSYSSEDQIRVYVFLHESCIISKHYTLPLKALYQEYASEEIQFIGLFPNASSTHAKIEQFKKTYEIPFELMADHAQIKTAALGASITPEVIVYNESKGEIIYKGRIDDTYVRVGQKRRITTSSELKNVLEAIKNQQEIPHTHTQAVGCFIQKVKSENKESLSQK